MKKFFLLILFLLILNACNSTKSTKESSIENNTPNNIEVVTSNLLTQEDIEIKKVTQQYLNALKTFNINNIMAFTYPKLFTVTSKYLYKGSIYTMINSSNIKINSFNTIISSIKKVQPFSNGRFTTINYTSIINIKFLNPNLYNNELSLNTLQSILSKKYGQSNIYVDKIKRTIKIIKEEKLLAIKENNTNWKFVGDNTAYRVLYPHFIPNDILGKI